ncbi:MAG TPA: RhuM family protein [Candidatus Absconditabacterales bacterium]|nr:RhuM family protein [Candidatus Absconditabacterales bacterium]
MKKEFPIKLYKSPDGAINIDVKIEGETIWLSQEQIATIFGVNRQAITKHINNILKEGELNKKGTSSILEQVQTEGKRRVIRQVQFYNLDMIISIGYRVNSKKATHFRIRATSVLKNHIIKGYSINQNRLQQTGISDLQASLEIVKRALKSGELTNDESRGLAELMVTYIPSLITLNQYDTDSLPKQGKTSKQKYIIDHNEAQEVLAKLKQTMIQKGEATDLFALSRGAGLDAIFGAIYQGFNKQQLYPTVEEKAANLLYLVIKNHPFADGNKRSGAFLFVRYLSKNGILTNKNGINKISEQTLVALALLVATSNPKEKELIIKLTMALLEE